jgi:hypothetical protein
MQQRKKRRGLLGTLLLTAILVTAVFAYTNTIGFPAATPNVGSGDAATLGTYNVTDIAWNSTGSNLVDSVALTFSATAVPSGTVRVDVGTGWLDTCAVPVGNVVTCALNLSADKITKLSVFAQDA